MNEHTQHQLLLNEPNKLFESRKYQKALKHMVKKFVAKKCLGAACIKIMLQELNKVLYTGFLQQIKQNFDPRYNLLLPFFERTVFLYCTNIETQLKVA